jgi:hypothetical protein
LGYEDANALQQRALRPALVVGLDGGDEGGFAGRAAAALAAVALATEMASSIWMYPPRSPSLSETGFDCG